MAKVLKVRNKTKKDSILSKTVINVEKSIQKKERKAQFKVKRSNLKPKPKPDPALKLQKAKLRKENFHKQAGVVYLSHIPHGFYEEQLEKFFSQFGKVFKVKLCRSTVSGRSKGYAFILFRFKEVAEIAAETTNNYLFGKRLLKAKLIPPDEVNPKWFRHTTPSNPMHTVSAKRRAKFVKQVNKKLTPEENKKRLAVLKRSVNRMATKLKEKGINYTCQTS